MQTFLPYDDFAASAASLDQARLGKQRVEGLQVLNVFMGVRAGWGNHPITNMWRGYERSLAEYTLIVCEEWSVHRGYRDTVADKVCDLYGHGQHMPMDEERPPWLGNLDLHISHQSNLLRKSEQYRLHHLDLPHEPHNRCDGVTPHKPHPKSCDPDKMNRWYVPLFPGVPLDVDYVWPVPKNA